MRMVDDVVEQTLGLIPQTLKRRLRDPSMPNFASKAQDRMIDAIWADLREELMWDLALSLDIDQDCLSPTKEDVTPPVGCLRAFARYHLDPFDRSFWSRLMDPWWVLFKLLSAVPVMGIAPFIHLLLFVVTDKEDEYQLVKFILNFKGMHFVTLGVLKVVLGYILYYRCTTGMSQTSQEHLCRSRGPGGGGVVFAGSLLGTLICACLAWVAFYMLRFSKEKGRPGLKHDHQHLHMHIKGGRLRPLLVYDLCTFALCGVCVVVAGLTYHRHDEEWRIFSDLFWAQMFYGLLSLPFLPFALPLLRTVLTHARATGYDREGRCLPIRVPTDVELSEAEDTGKGAVSQLDVHGMMLSVLHHVHNLLKVFPSLYTWLGHLIPGVQMQAPDVQTPGTTEGERELRHSGHLAQGMEHTVEVIGRLRHVLADHLPDEELEVLTHSILGHLGERMHFHHGQKVLMPQATINAARLFTPCVRLHAGSAAAATAAGSAAVSS